jgi:hypothetical protein
MCSHRKHPAELDPAAEEGMQSALGFLPTSLVMLCSTTARFLPHNAPELRHAETTISDPQLEANPQVASLEQIPGNHDIFEQSA